MAGSMASGKGSQPHASWRVVALVLISITLAACAGKKTRAPVEDRSLSAAAAAASAPAPAASQAETPALPGADILASRLQGQDVTRSSFFNVVREQLGWSDAAEALPLPVDLQTSLV